MHQSRETIADRVMYSNKDVVKHCITIETPDDYERLRIGTDLHEQLIGNQDYIDNNIVLNIENPRTILLAVFKECENIPNLNINLGGINHENEETKETDEGIRMVQQSNEQEKETEEVIDPEEAAKRAEDIVVNYADDPEVSHSMLDDLMTNVLNGLGYTKLTKIFEESDKLYV